jgi:hypothetical protein
VVIRLTVKRNTHLIDGKGNCEGYGKEWAIEVREAYFAQVNGADRAM